MKKLILILILTIPLIVKSQEGDGYISRLDISGEKTERLTPGAMNSVFYISAEMIVFNITTPQTDSVSHIFIFRDFEKLSSIGGVHFYSGTFVILEPNTPARDFPDAVLTMAQENKTCIMDVEFRNNKNKFEFLIILN
tara:strand:- start:971 stop:1384 length:414 start_codon:yes stop_codon:yes gene_type:complete